MLLDNKAGKKNEQLLLNCGIHGSITERVTFKENRE